MDWNQRCLESIMAEKVEAAKRYGIRFGQTEIYCIHCGKSWGSLHLCQSMSSERRAEVETLKAEFESPMLLQSPEELRAMFGIKFGMLKEEAIDKFSEWMTSKRTCQRCEEEMHKYRVYCPYRLICEEVENGTTESRTTNLGEEFSKGTGSIERVSCRTSPARVSVAKHWGQGLLF